MFHSYPVAFGLFYFYFVGIVNVLHIKNEILLHEVAWRDIFIRIYKDLDLATKTDTKKDKVQ